MRTNCSSTPASNPRCTSIRRSRGSNTARLLVHSLSLLRAHAVQLRLYATQLHCHKLLLGSRRLKTRTLQIVTQRADPNTATETKLPTAKAARSILPQKILHLSTTPMTTCNLLCSHHLSQPQPSV